VIIRILAEGQFDVPDGALTELNQLDSLLQAAVDGDDTGAFHTALTALLERVRSLGTAVDDDYLGPSELVLPREDATLIEVSELLTEEGLIPG
jgi:hypothetical protein